ncbi:MAG TPA: excisionase family DNA-binding protein [Pseudonocardiaceae bacterium]|jgi:excisionase family DNA binding protein|nr:excisionase family DNA-binding protein [Pseudonocardiaceae bacterium]
MSQPLPADDTEPILPSAAEARLLALVRDTLDEPSATRLLGAGGETVELPRSVREVLVRVVRELAQGNAVAVLPVHAELTTQEAADLLNVSRPYLIGLTEQGTLCCTRTAGNHRRLRLADVLTYKRARDTERRVALDEMSAEAEKLDLSY